MNQTITIKEYLNRKNIIFRESGKELITGCIFNNCDENSRNNEAHLYFDSETGKYNCKKCGTSGNLITLAKHFGDEFKDIQLNPSVNLKYQKASNFDLMLVESCHQALPINIRQYLNDRSITNNVIDNAKIGWGKFYNKWWITIPIMDSDGIYKFFKLRQDPSVGNDKITYPKGVEAELYGIETLQSPTMQVIVCEGELDRLTLISNGLQAVTSTHGAMTFKQEWVEQFKETEKVYICYDNDEAGKKGAFRVLNILENIQSQLYLITLPEEIGIGGDITDYFVKLKGNTEDLFNKYAKPYPEKIDTSNFKPLTPSELIEILGITIKKDDENKLITFLCELTAFTGSSQLNISFNAPSSTGKSYIPTEIAQLFPPEDVIEVAYSSPTAFFHDHGEFIKEKQGYIVDLSRKIVIFLDQPHSMLLQHMRPLLSHDKKEICIKITDKSQKAGLKTKNIYLIGYPSVIFCTAGLKIDEQETTRFILLSPETNSEKIREAIHQKILKETDGDAFKQSLENNPERKLLKERIRAVKQEKIEDINIGSPEKVEEAFFKSGKISKPRDQRDIGKVISLIKGFALINLWFRERQGKVIIANDEDIIEAFKIWDAISESQELNLPPYVYKMYKEVIVTAWNEKNQSRSEQFIDATGLSGLTRLEITQKHLQVYGRTLAEWYLRQQIIPMLENAGLITQEADQNDKRKMLIYPINPSQQNNSELDGRVEKDIEEIFGIEEIREVKNE